MGLFDLFRKQKDSMEAVRPPAVPPAVPPRPEKAVAQRGNCQSEYVKLTRGKCRQINEFFIAFDLETTGLSPDADRIIEIGGIAFENGEPVEEFSTLVNPGRRIPPAATAVNGITDEMVKYAPDEWTALEALLAFFDKYSRHHLIFVGHNANFDFSFLKNALNRYGVTRNFQYFDTLHASRSLIKGLPNYKQDTVATHMGLVNKQAHRASSDALVCGEILLQLAPKSKKDPQEYCLEPKNIPSVEEMAVCAYIQKLLLEKGAHAEDFTYYRNSSGYVTISSFYEVARFKFAKKGHYFIVDKEALTNSENPIEDCTASEGGAGYKRVFFTHPAQLSSLQKYFFVQYKKVCESRDSFFTTFPLERARYTKQLPEMLQLSVQTMNQLIEELDPSQIEAIPVVRQEAEITRDMVTIDVPVTRKPLSQTRNKYDWNKGFDQGVPYIERAEEKRKKGTRSDLLEAVALLDQAREYGYCVPGLYVSYSKAYRKLKDYQNEILICEEGINRFSVENPCSDPNSASCKKAVGELEARRNKAVQLLYKQQNPAARRK